MKKILICILLLLVMVLCLTACNKQIFDFKYEYTNAYLKVGDEWIDVEIEKWNDYEGSDQIQIILKDGTVIYTTSLNCILYKGTLPKGE